MKRTLWLQVVLGTVWTLAARGGEALLTDAYFPQSGDVRPPLRVEPDPRITVDADGNYCLDGKPRFLVGPQFANTMKRSIAPTEGYDPSLKWIYEEPMNHEAAQRLGFDTAGYFTSEVWIKEKYVPDYVSFHNNPEETAFLTGIIQGLHLPLYVDFTCAGWAHGKLATSDKYKALIGTEALNAGGAFGERNHWVPYSVTHPTGRKLYADMWEFGTRRLKADGGQALFYELFNEPAYNDPSPYNRGLFAQYLERKYGETAKMNAVWRADYPSFAAAAQFKREAENPGLYVDWAKFMEDSFTDVCKLGVETIKQVDPAARCCVQVMGMDLYRALPKSNVNLYKLAPYLETMSTCTGGGIRGLEGGLVAPPAHAVEATSLSNDLTEGILTRHFYRAISAGKPIHDGEAYAAKNLASITNMLWLQLMRGGNAAYLFVWSKRAWDQDWKPSGSAEGGRRVAEKFPWLFLNPWAKPTEMLTGAYRFKEDLYKVDDLFVPRNHNVAREVAVLVSYPTERYAPAVGSLLQNEVRTYAGALEFAHYPQDVILEEQLAEGRQKNYRVIVAAGVHNIYPDTVKYLREFVEQGGTLITGLEPLPEDEYGNPVDWGGLLDLKLGEAKPAEAGALTLTLPQPAWLPGELTARPYRPFSAGPGWEAVGSLGDQPVLVRKAVGGGQVYYLGAYLPQYALAGVLGAVLDSAGVARYCDLRDAEHNELAVNVEVHKAVREGRTGYFFFNFDQYPKVVRLACAELAAGGAAVEPLTRRRLEVKDGAALLVLPPAGPAIVVCGAEAELSRYGQTTVLDEAAARALAAELARNLPKKEVAGEADFPIDASRARALDLRPYCNRSFVDKVAGDGVGGWTDQGAQNSLQNVPGGRQVFLGVPFDLIRFDENADRTCIALRSQNMPSGLDKVEGVPVGQKAKALYFLHATAWSARGTEALRYVIHYADGTTAEAPIRCGFEVGEWWLHGALKEEMVARMAWKNSDNRGFFAYRWENPQPEKTIDSLDIVSANAGPIPLVIAITVEEPGKMQAAVERVPLFSDALPAGWQARGWSEVKWLPQPEAGGFRLQVGKEVKDWGGVGLAAADAGAVTFPVSSEMRANGYLTFLANGSADEWGHHAGGQTLQISLGGLGNGDKRPHGGYVHARAVDGDPATWEKIAVPLARLIPPDSFTEIAAISLQYCGTAPVAGIAVRNFALERY